MSNTEDAIGRGEYTPITRITPEKAAWLVEKFIATVKVMEPPPRWENVFGVPTGGCVIAAMVAARLGIPVTENIKWNTLVVDAIIESGLTRDDYPGNDFFALISKKNKRFFAMHKYMTMYGMDETKPVKFWFEKETGY